MEIPNHLFHYTVGIKLPQIQSDGYLKTTPTEPKLGERPLVWLSSNKDYEQTARKHFMTKGDNSTRLGSMEEMDEFGNGVYRFSFPAESLNGDLSPLPWPVLKHRSRIKKKVIDRLVKRAKGVRAKPSEWWGVMDRLPISIATLERLDIASGRWEVVSMEEAIGENSRYEVEQVLDNEVPKELRSRDEHWQEG